MKRIITICLSLCSTLYCFAQNSVRNLSDSLAIESRIMADKVLSKFDTLSGKKILYSRMDKDYYVIIQQNDCYKEYYITIDGNGESLSIKELRNDEELKELKEKRVFLKGRRRLKQLQDSRAILNKAFKFKNDHCNSDLVSSMTNATYVAGVPTYFVMKDENNERCGEFSLSSITIPCPIDPLLWIYLTKQLLKNIE